MAPTVESSGDGGDQPTVPGAPRAQVDVKKLREYCLDPLHLRGKHKARLFHSKLGITADDFAMLRDRLIEAVNAEPASRGRSDRYGERYLVDFDMEKDGRSARVRSGWIIRRGEDFPRLVTCYVLLE